MRPLTCAYQPFIGEEVMKKIYEKPTLNKREKLSGVVAIQGSGPV
ncbi:MAG: hypothetical protein AB1440_26990 [Pseudomonadota bacterium]